MCCIHYRFGAYLNAVGFSARATIWSKSLVSAFTVREHSVTKMMVRSPECCSDGTPSRLVLTTNFFSMCSSHRSSVERSFPPLRVLELTRSSGGFDQGSRTECKRCDSNTKTSSFAPVIGIFTAFSNSLRTLSVGVFSVSRNF